MRCTVATLGFLLAACADMEPFDPPVAGELNPEPGLLSGPTGEFVVFGRDWSTNDERAAPAERRLTDPPPP